MCRFISLLIMSLFIVSPQGSSFFQISLQETVKEEQVLYNGRIWKNLYSGIRGDQFMLTREFLAGSVTMKGIKFAGIQLKYDIFKDELLTPAGQAGILQLNKEMIDSFSFEYQDKTYRFIKTRNDSIYDNNRFIRVLYPGKTFLFAAYSKRIKKLGYEGEQDLFYQLIHIYLSKNGKVSRLSGRSDLLNALSDHKDQVKAYIRKNGLSLQESAPESFINVVAWYDSISK